MNKKIIPTVLIAILSILLFHCSDSVNNVNFNYAQFLEKKTQWLDHNIPNYTFGYTAPGFMGLDVNITVRNFDYYSHVHNNSIFAERDKNTTINEIFSEVESLYISNNGKSYSPLFDSYLQSIEITYDPVYGFPTKVTPKWIDPPGLSVDRIYVYFELKNFIIDIVS